MAPIDRAAELRRLERIAELMDSMITVPGTSIRIGLDGLIGLIPGIGDAAGTVVALYLVNEARRLGAPNSLVTRMLTNVGIDLLVGAVPVFGDLFDFAWKANRRNMELLRRHLSDLPGDVSR